MEIFDGHIVATPSDLVKIILYVISAKSRHIQPILGRIGIIRTFFSTATPALFWI